MSAGILVLLICLGFGGQVHATLTDEHQATLDAYHSTPCREMFGREGGPVLRRSVLKKGVIIPRGPKLSTPGTFQRVLTKEDSSWMVQALQNQTITDIQQSVARCKRPTAEMRQINEKFAKKLMYHNPEAIRGQLAFLHTPERLSGRTVLVSDKYKFILIVVYKDASRTFMEAAESLEAQPMYPWELTLEQLEYFKFTFVREPIPRYVSGYKTIMHRLNNEKFCGFEHENYMESMRAGLRFMNETQEPRRFNIFTEEFTGQSPLLYPNIKHILTQMYFLTQTLEDGTPISREFDFIGKLETIDNDWKTVGTILGFSHLDIQLQHLNTQDGMFDFETIHNRSLKGGIFDFSGHEQQSLPFFRDTEKLSFESLSEEMQRRVCGTYLQDFTCFNYQVPVVCRTLSE